VLQFTKNMLMSFNCLHIYALSITFFALPRLLVLAALPSPLQSLLPACAQSCLEDYLQQDLGTSICPDSTDLNCLCSHYGTDGYTLGERAYACLYTSSCTQTSRSNGTEIFSVCQGQSNAVTPTHKTVIITATPSTMMTSTSSAVGVKTTPVVATSFTQSISSAATTTMAAGATFSTGPDGTKMSGNISLTMAHIAGITIAAAALLILTVGIACCLIFVRKRNKRLEMEDQKVLIYDNSPDSQHNPHVLLAPRKDPRGWNGGVGIIPLHRYSPEPPQPQEEQRTWPRYYPVVPDEQAIAAIVSQSLMNPPRPVIQPSNPSPRSSPNNPNRKSVHLNSLQGLQNRGTVVLPPPLPPAQAHPRRSKPPPLKIPQNVQPRKDFSPISAATDFEEDDPNLRPRSNFAGSRPMSGMDFGEWPKPPVNTVTVTATPPPKKQRTSRPPTLTLAIPNTVQTSTLPPPPPRPPLVRQEPIPQAPPQQRPYPPPPSQSQQSSYSSAIASSQALGASINFGTSSERSRSNSRRPSKSSARSDSQASYTSFETTGSEDDPTPPEKEEEKRLSPVHESPVSYIRYPKVPRASNQIVPRTPPSQWNRGSDVSSLRASPNTMASPNARGSPNVSDSPVMRQGIGNKLWKTEISPQGTRPQYATWGTKSTPPSMSGPFSPGFGQMPKVTPTRRGEELWLELSR
jgi:hypothetical protein